MYVCMSKRERGLVTRIDKCLIIEIQHVRLHLNGATKYLPFISMQEAHIACGDKPGGQLVTLTIIMPIAQSIALKINPEDNSFPVGRPNGHYAR